MAKYLLTANTFEGSITYGYSDIGLLRVFEINAQLTEEQHAAVLKHLRSGLDQITFIAWAKQHGYKILELQEDLSWEAWYNLYNYKRNGEKARPLYNTLNEQTLQKLFYGTKAYNRYCSKNSGWYNKMLPDTFLRNKHYNDEWDKL